jgi:thiamine biosynthesis lipoprotein
MLKNRNNHWNKLLKSIYKISATAGKTCLRKPAVIALTLSLIMLVSGCSGMTPGDSAGSEDSSSATPGYITASDFLLNTVITINLYDKQDEDILNGCFDLISKYENIFSRTLETSELYALNHGTAPKEGNAYTVSKDLSDIINDSLYFCRLSKGAFDITIEPVSSLWDFTAATPVVPKDSDIQAALPLVGYQNLSLTGNQVTFAKDGMGIDLGAIAKGYIADRVKEYLLANGVKSAMINLGGNVLCVGSKPDGTPFHVGIQKPFADRNKTVAIMDIDDLSVVSSGVYERYFQSDGKLYHHILDPSTGYSYENNLISVTIISKKSTDGDGLSTTCFALGLEKGLALIAALPDTYAVFITSDYQIYYSEGLKEAITITEE